MSAPLSGPGSAPQAPGREPARPGLPRTSRTARQHAPITATGLVVKVVLLGLVAGIAIWAAFPLIEAEHWIGLGILVATTAGLFYLYLSRRHIPAKYLVPGTLFLIAFQVFPVLYTASTAFTNFGDGHRGSKDDAIVAVQTSSVKQVPGSTEYNLTIATKGDPASGPLVFLLSDPKTKDVFAGDADGLRKLDAADVEVSSLSGKITAADGYTLLNIGQASSRSDAVTALIVPTDEGAIRSNGLTRAYEGKAIRAYDAGCDCVKDSETGKTWTADEESGSFVAADGERLAQGWKVDVGLKNFSTVLTDPNISGPFFGTLAWNFAFAIGSTGLTFLLGMAIALALHSPRMRGTNFYRVLLILPYAMPSFAMLLIWRDMFNTDFGLLNNLFGLDVDWFGGNWSARIAVLLVQLWLGYPYMFLVATGALQAIPRELTEATSVDGASPWQSFRSVTLPLLLVALSPLLIASFAYNFNNVNAILFTTEGGPFAPDNPTNGATDLLITYTYRLAFGAQGAEFGLAATVSIFIFAIVATVSAISFRRTRKQEEVYS
ncbi:MULTISPECIES: ABC transporter permease subunit [Micromonospora]|uniref:Maltose/maltodextrin transport system permease protein n=3 Tax=Micromonospora TaxID=1873 RepID=A0ABX9XW84_MICCH|nr:MULTISPECIES: ABC transporter permease subunit [Micromonospora]EWM66053.1 maltose ABC transporter permease [Micromonospora sp. M42]MBC8991117.1 ABC transporter permease subunit [Micromonospora chalcea]MBQ1066168.1 ABC transporter permease subunit [Micromonospora sp. D75]MCK1808545.1 ABC transporter permease subunit [Micromonospora sp. R42106]MCK1833197.1 ABC transporter permease subunit [Micromonospora sp. R42003]